MLEVGAKPKLWQVVLLVLTLCMIGLIIFEANDTSGRAERKKKLEGLVGFSKKTK